MHKVNQSTTACMLFFKQEVYLNNKTFDLKETLSRIHFFFQSNLSLLKTDCSACKGYVQKCKIVPGFTMIDDKH